jgi:hypothetical protein
VAGEETKLETSVAREALLKWDVVYPENEDFAKYLKTRFKPKPRSLHYTATYAGPDLGEDGKRMSGTYEVGYVYFELTPAKPTHSVPNVRGKKVIWTHPEGKGRNAGALDEDSD